jgi:aspartate/methionine/tyrosine aminotransferase
MGIVEELEELAEKVGVIGDFGLGSPNEMPPLLAVSKYAFELFNNRHGYAPGKGMLKTREAVLRRSQKLFCANLDAEKNIRIREGTRGAIPDILKAFVGKVVVPLPFYPGHVDAIRETGCEEVLIQMPSVGHFLDKLEEMLAGGFRPSVVILSFDNPRWLPRTFKDYERVLGLAIKYKFIIISDEAYRDLGFDNVQVESIMRVPFWWTNAFVLESASKAFCGAGWKIGVVIASEQNIGLFDAVKAKRSEGGCIPAQLAYATALNLCWWYPKKIAARYQHRSRLTVSLLSQAGVMGIQDSFGGMFIYFRVQMDSKEFARELAKCGYLVRPGECFGEEGWIRWCLREPDRVTVGACGAVAKILQKQDAMAA